MADEARIRVESDADMVTARAHVRKLATELGFSRTDATLIAIAEARPRTRSDLVKVQGLGPTKADRYGEDVLAIIGSEGDRAAP